MLGLSRFSRLGSSDVARARLRALRSGWVPNAEMVAQAFASDGSVGSQPLRPLESSASPESLVSQWPVGEPDLREPLPPRLTVAPSAARGLLVLALGAVVGAAVVLVLGWPRGNAAPLTVVPPVIATQSQSAVGTDSMGTTSMGASPTGPSGTVVVDVAGNVRKPGVIELPAGSRTIDAIDAAGGVTGRGDTSTLNLAQVLVDGEQVLVSAAAPRNGAGGAAVATSPTAPGSNLVNINTATLEQLDTLPGIGPVLAQAIIDWRTQNGGFASVDQLQEVSGIGAATYADLEPLVRV